MHVHQTRRLESIQSLRGIAGSLVVVDHATEYMIRRNSLSEEYYQFAWFVGWIGVAIFFVLSGFLMITTNWNRFGSFDAGLSFFRQRALRIVPLYWIATVAFSALAYARGSGVTIDMLLKSLFFVPYLDARSGHMHPIAGQGWTLNYEMAFYLIFAICILLGRKAAAIVLIGALVALIVVGRIMNGAPYNDPASIFDFFTDPIIGLFALGVGVGVLYIKFPVARSGAWAIFGALSAALVCIAFLHTRSKFPLQFHWQIIASLSCAFVVYSFASLRKEIFSPLLQIAGDCSYSTYLFHPFVLMALVICWDHSPQPLKQPIFFIIFALASCNVAGYLIFRALERPIAALTRRGNLTSQQGNGNGPHGSASVGAGR